MSVFRKAWTRKPCFAPPLGPLDHATWSMLRRQQQFLATDKQVDQRAGDEQAVSILLQSSITHLDESELQLHHLKHVLDFGPHLRFPPVLRPGHGIHDLTFVTTTPLPVVPRSGRAL